jgi:2-polyprenyl-3-methyl-5-hydroxy-6-metoxy-1,4-benzoquinol methylase
MLDAFPINSVLDVGCATGTSLAAWLEAGVPDIRGIDGSYVDPSQLDIEERLFTAGDLSLPISLNRTFDLVQSLEVAEHINPDAAATFVDTLVQHSNGLILFSAAPPGQGGESHINERPYDFWRRLFGHRGYEPFDYIRPRRSE